VLEPQLHTSAGEQSARVGEIDVCYETFGDPAAPPMLLVMGLGGQMVLWDDRFCETLAERGFYVIRFDNRDVGRSTILRELGVPTRTQLFLRDRRAARYSLEDMAADAAGLMRQLDIGGAHVVGVSMGGMIAQLLAIQHPRRVRSLVSIMSSTGNRRVGQAHPRLWPRMVRRPRRDREGYIRDFIETYQTIGSTRYPPDPERMRRRAERCFDRGLHPSGAARQLAAVITAYDRTPFLRELDVPTTVIHGRGDPLVRPSGGRATAEAIPGARLLMLDGMGHDMPPELWLQIIDAIAENTASSERTSP
jgi:pimeloyl-ACP methyl ester carboxylesterase